MICPNCGAQWQLPESVNVIKKECPFCGGNMCATNQEFTTLKDALKEMLDRFGISILNDGKELLTIFSEFAPTLSKEKSLLQFFVEYNGHADLMKILQIDPSERKDEYCRQVENMTEKVLEIYNIFGSFMDIKTDSVSKKIVNNEYDYKDLKDNTVELTLLKGELPEVVRIPSTVDGKKVVSISGDIFGTSRIKDSDRNKVKEIYIPEEITTIGNKAFYGCKALNKVILPNGLTSIGSQAFKSCKSLANIILPESITYIGKEAFSGTDIRDVVLPKKLEVISVAAFKNCKQLETVEFPMELKTIEEDAFCGCKKLKSVSFPLNLKSICRSAFRDCRMINDINFSKGIEYIHAYAFSNCDQIKKIHLPNSITEIGYSAFTCCTSLQEVILSNNITSINYDTFCCCESLKQITIPDSVTRIEDVAFANNNGLHITIPNSVVEIEKDAFYNCKKLVIHCEENSFAYQYAKKNKRKIELLK